mmetsp:Transcript_87149/g.251330  ORF Transcript_87149/g.251330 Transcript_87149/m.251330 type:complete len:402 (-) Transcript_87149:63-1268(-)
MDHSLLDRQALAGAATFGQASAPPGPVAATQEVTRDYVDHIALVQGGLTELGVPPGLARVVAEDDQRIGLRIYLLDNSGSTSASDGTMVTESAPGSGRWSRRTCTRWEEICALAEDHARWNLRVGTPCEFVLLNSMGRPQGAPMEDGRDCLHVDRSRGGEADQVEALRSLLKNNGPRGVTPITERLEDIRSRIQGNFQALSARRQMVFLVIVTDGLPTSPISGESTVADKTRMVEVLRGLCATLPMQLVIRLCTDDSATIEFYNRIDEELELPLDILDDLSSEAAEVAAHGNDWFAYTPLVHRIREAGTLSKVLDAIDERSLAEAEVQQLAECLVQTTRPMSHLGKRQFLREFSQALRGTPRVYDARTGSMRPAVDLRRLRAALRAGSCDMLRRLCCPCRA